jgi:hypothetical protein
MDYPEDSHLLKKGIIRRAADRATSNTTAVQPIMF